MTALFWIARALKTVVLCYHRVIPEETARRELVHRALYVTPERFERHVRWMRKNGTIVSHQDVFKPVRKAKFIITFDDGWKDNLRYVFPLAEKLDVPVTIFLSSRNIDEGSLFWSEEIAVRTGAAKIPQRTILGSLAEVTAAARACQPIPSDRRHEVTGNNLDHAVDLAVEELKLVGKRERDGLLEQYYRNIGATGGIDGHQYLLSWDDVRAMSRGPVAFGSHTHTHAFLDRIDRAAVDRELGGSKDIIEAQTGRRIDSLSYPNGLFRNEILRDRLSAHGYRYAFTLERDVVRPVAWHAIPRWLMYQGMAWRSVTARALAKLLSRQVLSKHRGLRAGGEHRGI